MLPCAVVVAFSKRQLCTYNVYARTQTSNFINTTFWESRQAAQAVAGIPFQSLNVYSRAA
jgi:hypothetical protein